MGYYLDRMSINQDTLRSFNAKHQYDFLREPYLVKPVDNRVFGRHLAQPTVRPPMGSDLAREVLLAETKQLREFRNFFIAKLCLVTSSASILAFASRSTHTCA